jgi:hypothetical protein
MPELLTVPATKNVIIDGGSFTATGNYSGYDAETSERYFIPARLMKAKGWTTEKDVPSVFFAVLTNKEYREVEKNLDGSNKLDEKGQVIPKLDAEGNEIKFTRDTITKVYATKEEHAAVISAVASYHGYLEQAYAQAKASIILVSAEKAEAVANAPM